jgi:hypothetical protein
MQELNLIEITVGRKIDLTMNVSIKIQHRFGIIRPRYVFSHRNTRPIGNVVGKILASVSTSKILDDVISDWAEGIVKVTKRAQGNVVDMASIVQDHIKVLGKLLHKLSQWFIDRTINDVDINTL